ncbi:MAG: Smr/MutS family protein [Desulfovermiculus sp.]|nr:Smr/MutS family protein [Desulfovermiculus sp.]
MDSRTLRLLDYFDLLGHLGKYARSEPGARTCLELRPDCDPLRLEEENQLLAEALEAASEMAQAVSSFPELQGVFTCLKQDMVLDEDGLWGVQTLLQAADQTRTVIGRLDQERFVVLRGKMTQVSWPERTWMALNRCLDPDGGLKDESSPELLSVRQEVRGIHSQCTKKVNEYLRQERIGAYLQDEYLTISADRYVLAIKSNFKGRLQGIIHDYSQTGETCYFEPMLLVELNNTLQELKQEEREAKKRVLRTLTSTVGQDGQRIRAVFVWMVDMDVLLAKVLLAQDIQGQSVKLGEQQPLQLFQARHPLLVLNGEDPRAVDIELKPGQRGLIISGGNAGGKTVCLKTLGLISLMALSSLPVPVQEGSSLPLWKLIFVFIGDEQSLQEHQSTFTAQIDHFRSKWPEMGASSLVLLDEFGAGTDPSQGAALAQAVMDALLERSVWVVAATHFPALKAYGLTKDQVRAATVLFDPQTQMPLYTLGYDQVGGSRALDVARDRGLPQEILRKAEEYLLLDGKDSSQLMSRLNELAVAREQEIRALQKQKKSLEEEQKRLQAKLEREARQLLEDIRTHSREVVTQWKAGKRQRKQALQELAADKNRLREQLKSDGSAARKQEGVKPLVAGEQVYYRSWGRKGLVREVDAKKSRIKLDLGGVTLWVPENDVQVQGQDASNAPLTPSCHRGPTRSGATGRVDLRGMRSDEAVTALQQHVDHALLQGTKELEIIHGRGTGALRKAVQEELARLPGIIEFCLANEEQGGDGVTIVRLQ